MNWLASADDLAETLPAAWLVATSEAPRNLDERSRLRRSVGGRVLGLQLGEPVTIAHEPGGRPFIAGRPGLHVSLATRAGIVAVALARGPVGVDVEALSEAPFPLAMLHEAERRSLESLPEAARPLAFARLWAAKEAYVKALGTGFRREPDSFAVTLDGARFGVDDPSRPVPARGWLRTTHNGGQVTLAAAAISLAE